ncbi:MAG: outer membrane protein assembly factor BamE [Rhodoferax sp.]|uniref:outer membrane protein assembly factor BamE n=1 Tax=Rhodoferax sp. TaxID=50421 RepID=UPI002ACDE851|nr:outer membrane protein assembly factor BamE [Rhodoferax sp.]MDZ7890849.1 outer membrane protein assembly factor BamE [Rhodoferax sp.]
MPLISIRSLRTTAVVLSLATLGACGSVRSSSDKALGVLTPYKIDIVQGNVVTREQLAVLRVGMPRAIAQDVLGTPLLTSVFHADRWDYVFTLKRQGSEPQSRKVTLFFANDAISRIEADELPSETEFVSTLRSKVVAGPVPSLTASEEALKKFPAPRRDEGAATSAPPSANPSTAYPPLEPGGL